MLRKLPAAASLAMLCLLSAPGSASAQVWPGYGYWGGGYGGWGGAEVAEQADSTMRNIAAQQHAASQSIAAQQNATMQANIRNTLETQADMRSQSILNQQQANRDWWFQVQQQQMAQRRALSAGAGPAARQAFVPPSTASRTASAATDIIPWPPVLCDSRFAQQRALVEAPYRRDDGMRTKPTVADYENIIKAVDQMKDILAGMTSEILAEPYLHAEKFLNQLAAEARERIEKR